VIERRDGLTEEGQARRKFLKQAGTVAWASPFIVTMMSRAAHAQGQQCGVTALNVDVDPPTLFCNVDNPCGTGLACAPPAGVPGAGNPCTCVAAPG
jgi:hypothetical protein